MRKTPHVTAWIIGVIFGSICLVNTAMAADALQASISANKVGFGETVTLTLTADADQINGNPDLTPLQNDFDLLGQSTSSQTRIINGNRSATASWIITLAPKTKGSIEIPAISAGTAKSNPFTIDVVDVADLPAGTSPSQALHIEVLVDDKPHYVHAEIPVTVQVIDGAGMTEASLQAPSSKDFTLRQSGEDQYQQTTLNGLPVTVMQRHYLLTPLKSGELTLPPVQLQGMVPAPGNNRSMPAMPSVFGRSPFGNSIFDQMFNRGQQVRVQSESVDLTIKASPVTGSNWFLPAKDVQISAQWNSGKPTFNVGEAASRTVRLVALGAAKEKLPNLEFESTDGARIYLDRSDDKSADTPQGTAAVREFKVSVVPTRAGELEIPGIDVSWWDTETDQQRTASLPAETITVAGGVAANTAPATAAEPVPASTVQSQNSDSSDSSADTMFDVKSLIGISALALIAALASVGFYRRFRRQTELSGGQSGQRSDSKTATTGFERDKKHQQKLKVLHHQVVDASKANQAEKAYAAYQRWLATAKRGDNFLQDNTQTVRVALMTELEKLEAQLYKSSPTSDWQGKEFMHAFEAWSAALGKSRSSKQVTTTVPSLYPSQAT